MPRPFNPQRRRRTTGEFPAAHHNQPHKPVTLIIDRSEDYRLSFLIHRTLTEKDARELQRDAGFDPDRYSFYFFVSENNKTTWCCNRHPHTTHTGAS